MAEYNNKQMFQILNIIAVVGTIFVNYLANALPINGIDTRELSDAIPNLFVPAGLTFAIWGVIYILIILFAAYQARDLFKKEKIEMPFIKKTSYYFFLAGIANIAWIFAWHYQQVFLSFIIMLVLLGSLIKLYLNLGIGKEIVSRKERIFVQIPISVYLGWITVATIANATALLVVLSMQNSINLNLLGFSQVFWTIFVIAAALIITLLMIITRKDVAYSLVVVWALLGIYIKRTDITYGVQNDIALAAAVCAVIIVLGILLEVGADLFFRKQKS
ncbi:MAG: hypothetical protein APG12_00530 [Candidatus Methanofastidiosum methylothiophilum]|uniref:TspO/MBR family protein n=1 Tax=Candidatus Methanofastidiosum methylothiophilum TaxID=1705564 RepID=A0A150J0S3_9EURY|nr:MAG: hypothetical protein APG10_00439 [Candidatus Methanofastidiosum methylthiophilus]KYC48188.1 MAG: hypothetical protein APG11_00549 [Candidatus Methanofastidiosum methylthiophilus]KYC50843.1 MAG: hypothetical protein APG12_00530 [Candidatus Methanofastidiosum methylthiophilus]